MTVKFDPYIQINVKTLGSGVKKPDSERNFATYDKNRTAAFLKNPDNAVFYLKEYLLNPESEDGVLEALYILDRISDTDSERVKPLYPYLSKYNNSNSPDIQVMLSGIYRKTLPPDAFGPLCRMLYKQITSPNSKYFDPTEETGGAILEYLRSYNAVNNYPNSFNMSKK